MTINGTAARAAYRAPLRAALLAAVLAGCATALLARAQGLESLPPRGSAAVVPGAPVPATGATVLARAAQAVGIRRCYPAVDQVSARMLAGTQHADVALDWDRQDPDGEAFFALAGLGYADTSAVLSLTTVPAPAGGCTILVERVSSASLPCKAVAAAELRDYKGTPLVRAVTVYVNPGRPRETVTLVDAPPACLIIRRQVRFRWGAGP
ncbi:hypothetical protein [Burkholderia anthina]|uniref:hypothetical protein n=1 Tax=Burkholderia anthina TaxID=179879 RepID=UPI001AA08644|nr:hypothetical protein [Burkholderia anthina]QTD92065.1 hypothetical protein J4G50_27875 [Burkholderia anthina]